MIKGTLKGTLIAASVAGLFAAGVQPAYAADNDGEQVMCYGINECKGHGSCAGHGHSCSGKNGCKGQGDSKVTRKDCAAKGGTVTKVAEREKSGGAKAN
jgi:hypothetical protein